MSDFVCRVKRVDYPPKFWRWEILIDGQLRHEGLEPTHAKAAYHAGMTSSEVFEKYRPSRFTTFQIDIAGDG